MNRPYPGRRPIPSTWTWSRALLAAGLLAGPGLPSSVFAETVSAAGAAPTVATQGYEVPAGPLGPALSRVAGAAGVTLSIDPDLVEGLRTRGLSGDYAPEEALRRLLAGTGLEAVPERPGVYVLRRGATRDSAATGGAVTLPLVKVEGVAQHGEVTEGTGAYATRVTSTATKLTLSPRETPQTVTIITRQIMDDFATESVTDVLRLVPGLNIGTADSDRNTYTARGFPLQVQYDGTPFGGGLSGEVIPVPDAVVVDRTEVLLGASGLMNGAGEPGGSIDIVWKRPTAESQVQASASVGSWDERRLWVDASGPLTDSRRLRGRVVAMDQSSESFRDFERDKKSLFYAVLEADATDSTVVSARFQFQDFYDNVADRSGLPKGVDGADLGWDRDSFLAPAWNRWNKSSKTYWLVVEQQLAADWMLKAQASRVKSDDERLFGTVVNSTFEPETGDAEFSRWGQDTDDTTDSAELFARGGFQLLGRTHELVIGGNWSRWRWSALGAAADNAPANLYDFDPRTSVPLPELVWNDTRSLLRVLQYGAYAAGRLNLTDRLKAIVGSRVSWYEYEYPSFASINRKEDAEATPYAGLVYDLNRWASAYASYADIFNPQASRSPDGATLQPVVGANYEAGFKGEFFGGRLNASAAVFRVEKTNEAKLIESIPYDPDNACGGSCYEASGKTQTEGFDLNLAGEVRSNWQVLAGYSHYKKDGYKAADIFKLSTRYELPGGHWTLGGSVDSASKTVSTWNLTQDARTLVSLFGKYRVNQHISVALNLDNLFDEKYYSNAPDSAYGNLFYGEPRRWLLSLRGDF